MDKNEWERQDRILQSLSVAYVITCLFLLTCVYLWMGNLLIWMSIYLFGLPLLFWLLPLFGLFMFGIKGRIRILISFLISLTPLIYLIPAMSSFPFYIQTDAAGHITQISVGLTVSIIISASLFLISSVLSFIYCQKAYQSEIKKSF